MLAMIEIGYDSSDKFKNLTREQWDKLRTEMPQLDMSEWTADKDKPPHFYKHTPFLIELTTDGNLLSSMGITFEVKKFKNTYRTTHENVDGSVNHLHIHIPNIGLLLMDEVQLLEDSCTDALQRQLDEGWRIIAVCPPNAQRRPDYILGRDSKNSLSEERSRRR